MALTLRSRTGEDEGFMQLEPTVVVDGGATLGLNQPRIEMHVGVMKADLRFADLLVIENQPTAGQPPRVETFSTKSRDLSRMELGELTTQMTGDAKLALRYYGETLKIRRPGMEIEARVQRVRLIYEGGELKPSGPIDLKSAVERTATEVKGVEVSFQ
ncbi:hypothetical protein D7X74_25345 [Corallococcus sp. CA047B]|nr:hypothetical protein D7X74_25345 [Corallococcus sp. CA047B]